jgi:hypothetical protein
MRYLKGVFMRQDSEKSPLDFLFLRAKPEKFETNLSNPAFQLMDLVNNFNYRDAKLFAKKNPHCIFQKITCTFHGNTTEKSPLQQAFWNYDSYTWDMFYEIAKDNPACFESYKVQLTEMNEHFNIKPLHERYDEYISKCPQHFAPESIETNECLLRTQKIREEQDRLPKHFIFEMARLCLKQQYEEIFESLQGMGYALDKEWLWNKKENQTDGKCFNVSKNSAPPDRLVLVFEQDAGLGYTDPHNSLAEAEKKCGIEKGSSMLVRGDFILGTRLEMAVSESMLKLDLDNILSLYHQRQKELDDHRELLLQHTQTLSC